MTKKLTPETDYGTFQCGEANRNAKLTVDDVRLIRMLLDPHYTQREIAELFGVSQDTISKINTKKTWGWLK